MSLISEDDAISRKMVLDKINEVCFSREQKWVDFRVSYGSNGQRDLIIKFIESLPSIQPRPSISENPNKWIPVSERLPDEYGEYLVTKHTIGWNCEEYVSNDIAYFDNNGFHKADKVIAWKPLTEPYKPKDNEL